MSVAAQAALDEGYTIDAAGNRLTDRRTGTANWVYDEAGQLRQRGSVTYTYDDAGRVALKVDAALAEPQRSTRYAYDAFGKATIQTTAPYGVTSNLRLPGQYFDAESGLHYNDRRYYEPETGRYITRDPLSFGGGPNLYAYGRHNPLSFADPTGEIIPALAARYGIKFLLCFTQCMALSAAIDAVVDCGNVNWGDNAKDCGVDCLLSFLPGPPPTPSTPRVRCLAPKSRA